MKDIANLLPSSEASSNNYSEANELAPVGLSKIERVEDALQPYVQDLANELGTIPQFRTSRGSIQVAQNYNDQLHRTQDAVSKETFSPSRNFLPGPIPSHDHNVGPIMTDISALPGQVASLLAAFNRKEGKGPTKNNDRSSDKQPFPLKLSQSERNRRIDEGRCERCGCSC
ncbi:hypothetical protein K3495_g5426 [Podosphaera aphanis]|nr:hypothetical protein K3495_g5426 [Podosphaera aphanis]